MKRIRIPPLAKIIAYDFETTNIPSAALDIDGGIYLNGLATPRPLYITAYARDAMHYESAIDDMDHLSMILENQFLTDENHGVKFVAWNGNNYDAYFIAAALIRNPRFVLRPYLTKSNSVRGLRVMLREDIGTQKNKRTWEFLDGMAMLGLAGVSLAKFLDNFAPEHRKMVEAIEFERESFDAKNPIHRAYAMQDSIGLWHGMQRAQSILYETFDQPLTVTMGGACVKIFKAHIPSGVEIATPRDVVVDLTRSYVMRGGYCYCVRRFHGQIWKYDLNQAYAAAMRDADLPQGFTTHYERIKTLPTGAPYIARISATNPGNIVPFYYRGDINGRLRSVFGREEINETWLTSIEVEQLQRENWQIQIFECYAWEGAFSMREYVDKLECLRMSCDGGPAGPIGTMVKMVGNHSYGKTVEQIEPLEFVLCAECPDGYAPYYGDAIDPLEHVFFRFVEDQREKDYHQPQIGAFITAHVRMEVRRAAQQAPHAWLYADTDCVVFSEDVTDRLDIDQKRYGAWKIEEAGAVYKIIAKKVYAQVDGDRKKRSAKGMNVKRLTERDFDNWFDGDPPMQQQIQRQNFLQVMRGTDMFRAQQRRGTAIDISVAAIFQSSFVNSND